MVHMVQPRSMNSSHISTNKSLIQFSGLQRLGCPRQTTPTQSLESHKKYFARGMYYTNLHYHDPCMLHTVGLTHLETISHFLLPI